MYKIFPVVITGVTLILNACNTGTPPAGNSVSTDSTGAPVETKSANTNYKPAFGGQTRIGGIRTTTAFEGKMLSDQLNKPWGITSLPDGRLLITEKEGTMRIATP